MRARARPIPDVLNLARAANMSFAAWRTVRQAGLVRRHAQVAAIEQGASLIRVFRPALVPGLLQTRSTPAQS